MEDLFITYEAALLAKKHGFKEKCIARYYKKKLGNWYDHNSGEISLSYISAPLNQQIIAWFKTKGIFIGPVPYTSGKHKWQVWSWDEKDKLWIMIKQRILNFNLAVEDAFKFLEKIPLSD